MRRRPHDVPPTSTRPILPLGRRIAVVSAAAPIVTTTKGRAGQLMRIATWNVNCFNSGRRFDKRKLLELEDWDVALLQEVGASTLEAFTESGEFAGVSAVDLAGGAWSGRAHGAAILARSPWTISTPSLLAIEGEPWLRARAKSDVISDGTRSDMVGSMHMRNAAADGSEAKMAHYRAMNSWILEQTGTVMVGIDTNFWTEWLEPATAETLDDRDAFADEHRFVDAVCSHGLRDVLVDHLVRNRPELIERRRALGAVGPDGALEVTYQRAHSNHVKVNRADRIYASPSLTVNEVRTLYSDALTVGSDHAQVIADLT